MNNTSNIVNEKIVRVSDILEQIDDLNKMIDLHSKHAKNGSMHSQYLYMKKKFVNELNSILQEFKLVIKAA